MSQSTFKDDHQRFFTPGIRENTRKIYKIKLVK